MWRRCFRRASCRPDFRRSRASMRRASTYRQAANLEIGGDYYDVFRAPGGRLVLAIGDVCGKGVEAATKTSMIKYLVRGMIAAGADPGSVLAELNRTLVESGDPSDIVTLWFGMLESKTASCAGPTADIRRRCFLRPSGDVSRLGDNRTRCSERSRRPTSASRG